MKGVRQHLGTLDRRDYVLYVNVEPDWNDPARFAATVSYHRVDPDTGEEEKVEIARIENQTHGYAHVDRLWTAEQGKEEFEGGVYEAWMQLRDNWRKYARRYRRNHG
ncbi:MAG: hypothetical protein SVW02_01385 [Candidatus Nanohaloarchaea archaeon]|nr:hypothetical protein [Candidatus Nanohaloarchaea archaeon]